MYGYELWPLSSCNINDIFVAWCKSVYGVWSLLINTLCELLPNRGKCLSVLVKICKHHLTFLYVCVSHEMTLI